MNSILIVDDDVQLRQSFEKLLLEEGYEVRVEGTGEAGVAAVRAQVPDLMIMDVRLPGMNGLAAFRAIHEFEPKLPVIIMTAYGTTETAIEATKLGAFDYVLKPFPIPDILQVIEQALEAGRLMRSRVELGVVPESASPDAIIGRSETMQKVYKTIGRVAPTDATILIRGESGTGKELVARAIYQHGPRTDKPYVVINCMAIPETLLESELFGYERGAFTGAVNRRIGKIEQANSGTVFLDEIGDMPMSIQAKVLRLLQEKTVDRLGGSEAITVDVRIIAATNRDLEAALAAGKFREDLYYRLKVVTVELPALRDRKGDISLLCDYFLARYSEELGLQNPGLTEAARNIVETHPWPGNVRELANALQKALIFSRGYPIRPEDLSQAISGQGPLRPADDDSAADAIRQWLHNALLAGAEDNLFNAFTDRFASILIGEALKLTGGNRSRAAKLLGLSRPTLQSKIEKYHLKIETSVRNE